MRSLPSYPVFHIHSHIDDFVFFFHRVCVSSCLLFQQTGDLFIPCAYFWWVFVGSCHCVVFFPIHFVNFHFCPFFPEHWTPTHVCVCVPFPQCHFLWHDNIFKMTHLFDVCIVSNQMMFFTSCFYSCSILISLTLFHSLHLQFGLCFHLTIAIPWICAEWVTASGTHTQKKTFVLCRHHCSMFTLNSFVCCLVCIFFSLHFFSLLSLVNERERYLIFFCVP